MNDLYNRNLKCRINILHMSSFNTLKIVMTGDVITCSNLIGLVIVDLLII